MAPSLVKYFLELLLSYFTHTKNSSADRNIEKKHVEASNTTHRGSREETKRTDCKTSTSPLSSSMINCL